MSGKPKLYQFEGRAMTMLEIRQIVPALSAPVIARHLRCGRNTRTAMLYFNVNAAKSVNGRKGGTPWMRQYPEWARRKPSAMPKRTAEATAAYVRGYIEQEAQKA